MIDSPRRRGGRVLFLSIAILTALAGCTGAPAPSVAPPTASRPPAASPPPVTSRPSSTASPTPTATPTGPTSAEFWKEDLLQLDAEVRAHHPGPFTIHPESEWKAMIETLKQSLPTLSSDQQFVAVAKLVALLDTHSAFLGRSQPYGSIEVRFYQAFLYRFAEGWFVMRAKDTDLVGARLVSINGHSADDVEAAVRTVIPADNESGKLDGLDGTMTVVEHLLGLGIVSDPAKPAFVFELPDGTKVTRDLGISADEPAWEEDVDFANLPPGTLPEVYQKRSASAWTKIDAEHKALLFAFNDYTETGLDLPLQILKQKFDDGTVNRVVLDNRGLRGGNGGLSDPLIQALTNDPRINREGGLTVLIGRENVSAGTLVAARLERQTKAVFVGEKTPARNDNFLCECYDFVLENSKFLVEVPTFTFATGDPRDSVAPDYPVMPTAADYFAGKDSVLDAALAGDLSTLTP